MLIDSVEGHMSVAWEGTAQGWGPSERGRPSDHPRRSEAVD